MHPEGEPSELTSITHRIAGGPGNLVPSENIDGHGIGEVNADLAEESLGAVLWRRKWIVIAMAVVGLGAAVGYILLAAPMYRAEARLRIDPLGSEILGTPDAQSRLPENHLRTECEVLRSRPVVEAAIRRSRSAVMTSLDTNDDAVEFIQKQLVAQTGKRDDIVTISLAMPKPQEAKSLVGELVEAYIAHHIDEERSTATRLMEILRNQRHNREAEWTAKQQEMLDFQRANAELSFQGEKANVILERLARLSEALTAAQERRIESEAAHRAAQRALAGAQGAQGVQSLIEAIAAQGVSSAADPEYADLMRQLNSLRMSQAAMQRQAMPGHPMVRSTRQAVSALEEQVKDKRQRFAEAFVAMLDQRVQAARETEAQLQSVFEEQKKQALSLNSKSVERTKLTAELSRIEKATDLIETRLKDIGTMEQAGGVNIRVVEPAHVGASPSSPNRGMALGGGLAAGLLAGAMLALVRERCDQSLHTAHQVKTSLDTRMLTMIPHIPGRLKTATCGTLAKTLPLAPAVESYRFIRSAIEAELARGTGNVILITSTRGGEGKTTLITNLALVLAEAGRRILLVDADLRGPAMDRVFGIKCQTGLSNVLNGDMNWVHALQHTDVERLDVLPSGPIAANPSEFLSKPTLKAILEGAKEQYDVVLVDSPPVGLVSDAQILASLCNHTVFVVRAGVSSRHSCQEAMDRLACVGVRVLGVVVNDASEHRHPYGYQYGRAYTSAPMVMHPASYPRPAQGAWSSV